MLQARHDLPIGRPNWKSGAIRYESRMNAPRIPDSREKR
jgi:hypothetical protein